MSANLAEIELPSGIFRLCLSQVSIARGLYCLRLNRIEEKPYFAILLAFFRLWSPEIISPII